MSRRHKHIPVRMCVICRDRYPKRQLRRFVATDDGVFYDPTGKQEGRGAYICEAPQCTQQAAAGRLLAKALRVRLSDADRERIRLIAS
jgi:hypothetical protein